MALAILLGNPLAPVAALAQTERGSGMLEEIVVTARKREESIQDTPISITAFNGDDLLARQLDNIGQISESTPNLIFNDRAGLSGNSGTTTVFIRGVGQLDFSLNVEAGVGIYVDDVYVSRSTGSLIDLLDIQRVEVLRGPQGTLFGRNTTGGAVSITSKLPHEEFEAKVGLTAGSYDRLDVYGMLNLPLGDNLFNRTSIKYKERDGYYERLFDDADVSDVDSIGIRSRFLWQASETLDVSLSLDGTRDRQGVGGLTLLSMEDALSDPASLASLHNIAFAPQLDPEGAGQGKCLVPGATSPACYNRQWLTNDVYDTNGSAESKSDLDLWGVGATVNWDIGDLTFKSITAFRNVEADSSMDLDGSPLQVFDVNSQEMDNETFTQELRLLGTAFDDRLNWILGLYYLDEDGTYIETISAAFADLTSGGRTTTESKAVFAQGTYDFTDKLSMTIGIRYTEDEREFTPDSIVLERDRFSFVPVGTYLLPPTPSKISSDETTPMVNLSYALTEDFMIYATYSEGYKGGGFTQRVAEPQVIVPSFDPEFVTVYEIGSKFSGLDNRLRINGAVFFTDYEDIQVIGSQPGALGPVNINAGEAEIKGFEIELAYLPAAGLLLELGVGYLDAEYTSFTDAVADPEGSVNNEIPMTPEWSWNASISYVFEFASGHSLTPRIDYSYSDSVFYDFDNRSALTQDSYSLWNAALAFQTADGEWLATLSGKNLTDEEYLASGDFVSGMDFGAYALPRTWAINIEKRF
jgi:iron complex outermembrane receptor protein